MNAVMQRTTTRLAALVCAGLGLVASAFAQPATPSEQPEVWHLNVKAQAVARPALQYSLLFRPIDQVPGNAAPLYLMAMREAARIDVPPVDKNALAGKGLPPTDEGDMMYYYLALPLEKLPVKDLEEFMRPYESALVQLDAATQREYCRWELPVRDKGVETLVPYLNDARHLTNVASLRVRLHAARGEHAEALRGLRAIFELARDIGTDGLLFQALVGNGLAAVGVDRIREIVQEPGGPPNLYWPLANLPRPFSDLREALEWENVGLMTSLPPLKKLADGKTFTADDWRELVERQSQLAMISATRERPAVSLNSALGPAASGALIYPEAKRYLLSHGMPAEKVDALPVSEALGRYLLSEYQAGFDEMTKWAGLPYWQAQPGMQRWQQELFKPTASTPVRALLHSLPAVGRAASVFAKFDARIAALQTVEALRAYAAAHDGKLPDSLDALDAADTPAPLNPMTGKPFAYHVEADRAIIEIPAVPGEPPRTGLRVEVTIVK